MFRTGRRTHLATIVALSMLGPVASLADDPPRPTSPPKNEGEIKPLPPLAIPDDPPPHEGAMIDLPVTIEPPDIIVVEVVEALPGRPITGERIVRPDGTISLGFYGDLHVRGLTPRQVKVKVLQLLRGHLNDEVLGLMIFESEGSEPADGPNDPKAVQPPGGRDPLNSNPKIEKPESIPGEAPPAEKKPEAIPKAAETRENAPRSSALGGNRSRRSPRRRTIRTMAYPLQEVNQQDAIQDPRPPAQVPGAVVEVMPAELQVMEVEGKWRRIEPSDSQRVFVDVTSYNSSVYYVQGDVGVPGRLPITGKETVLDALNYAGGLIPAAEPADIHLYRPARGGRPSKDYKIDLLAIQKGDARANLQVFPNDRLIVGRNPAVKKTAEIDRAGGLINSVLNTILQYSFTARSLASINTPPSGGSGAGQVKSGGQDMPLNPTNPAIMPPAQRDAMVKEWYEFLWSISSQEGGAMLDEKAFREALMKKLSSTPTAEPKQ